ncbi:MAG TPA: hypothetical protein DDX98_14090 [Bacteroidales bacterium]|jgi:hypothetical protein|nr:hypothetical protein [Bacteroidales bacterium]
MKILIFHLLLVGLMATDRGSIFSINYIGKSADEIKELVLEHHKMYKPNTAFINDSYNYLKYEDRIREITVLFFLNDNNHCRMIRIMSDYSNINDLRDELDSNYESVDNYNWKYKAGNMCYSVSLTEEDWYFTIAIKKKE